MATTLGDDTAKTPALVREGAQKTIRAGFIPLMDASILIVAAELGFAEKEGLRLDLVRDVSWANVRDRLAFRQFDVAHMLSPMPVASMLGLGSNPSPTIAPFSFGRGGNAITLSARIFLRMKSATGLTDDASALANARALAKLLAEMRARGEPAPTLGMTYPFSSHNYEFRYWLAAGGIDPDRDVKLVVVPPPLTSDALAAGEIDGFCVGAPWNMIASERGAGRIVAAKQDIWPLAPEKVLGMRPDWAEANSDTVCRLIVALDRAARWCDETSHHDELAEILAAPAYIAAPKGIIRRVLSGEFSLDAQGTTRVIPDYFLFHRGEANYPRLDQATWIYSQMIRWGQTSFAIEGLARAQSAFRPDLYRMALGADASVPTDETERSAPGYDGFMDGQRFDPENVEAYVQRFAVRSSAAAPDGIAEA
ncbi:ABC-type nitrate/sulfonate/bicarbonate transport system substrate-binding protein [Rhizobium sp. SG_E_25_P2]|uniref:CmpA/NrtA family ABC transporter substrate-binding protein n=1 Tax=Rhizobium sp. SG_E_25_P2 TaxID=2879942 RepID=UPI00247435E5|nr:CmpA/NrtA family ABC transporter substrate-binding protein [Rhizobium sp. SG_E_25_P2]MDH6266181.1 ABC-type nitrate/sulfonate/bicarbonate transport system substrate-binding protein [Rhizobium sp. SG_E_25_P2]